MNDFEISRNITIGQYIPGTSVIHRLPPWVKLLACMVFIIAVSASSSLLSNSVLLLTVILTAHFAAIPFSYITRGLLIGLPILLFILVMQLLFAGHIEPAGTVYIEIGWLRLTEYSLYLIALTLLRITSFVFATSLLTMTSTLGQLTKAMTQLFRPLQYLGIPIDELALILTLALRFIPTLAEELERIIKAQVSRGANIDTRHLWRPDRAARLLLPLLIPLFISSLRRAEELVTAMQSRCYVSRKISVRRTVVASLLAAISMLLGWTRLGFIPVPNISGNATIMHIPAIIGAVLEGPLVGIIVGTLFGLFSFLQSTVPLFKDPLVAIVPRMFIGLVAYYGYALCRRYEYLALIIAGIAGTLTNTILVLAMAIARGYIPPAIIIALLPQIIAEVIIAAILTTAVVSAWKHMETRGGSSL